MSAEEAHDHLARVLAWAELFDGADPLKVQQLRDPLNTCHMVIDQLVERNGTISPS